MPSLAKIAACLPVISSVAYATAAPPSQVLNLKAASRRSELMRRAPGIRSAYEALLDYAHVENTHNEDDTFYARVKLEAERPIIVLEEIENHLQDVECSTGKINLSFTSPEAVAAMKEACDHQDGALLVTSHHGCNADDERLVYHATSHESDDNTLSFAAEKISFKDAFRRMGLSWGHTTEGHYFRHAKDLKKRQAENQPAAEVPVNDGNTGVTVDLNNQVLDTPLVLPEVITALLPVQIPVEVRCVDCSTTGTLDLTAGDFTMDLDLLDGDGIDFVEQGNVVLTANGVGARMELSVSPSASFEGEIPLPAIPLPALGFALPGIGSAGVTFAPTIPFAVTVNGGIQFSGGLQASIPDGSTIDINVADFGASAVTGFTEPQVEALPFQANITSVELAFSIGFRPRITLGFDFTAGATAEVGLFADIPTLTATITTLAQVDAQCQPLPEGAASVGDFTLIDSTIGVAVGVDAALQAPLFRAVDFETEVVFAETEFPIASTCFGAADAAPTDGAVIPPVEGAMPPVETGLVAAPPKVQWPKHPYAATPAVAAAMPVDPVVTPMPKPVMPPAPVHEMPAPTPAPMPAAAAAAAPMPAAVDPALQQAVLDAEAAFAAEPANAELAQKMAVAKENLANAEKAVAAPVRRYHPRGMKA